MAKGGGHGDRDGAAQSRHHTFASPDRVFVVVSPTTTPCWLLDDPLEELHVDLLAGRDVAGVGAEDDEAIRPRHRRQYSRALVAGRAHRPAAGTVGRQDASLKFGAARRLFDRRRKRYAERRRRRHIALALKNAQRIAYELVEGD